MSRKSGLWAGAVALVMTLTLAIAPVASASSVGPVLLSPNHKGVSPGRIRLIVRIPRAAARHGVFIAIQPNRKLRHGRLAGICSVAKGCDLVVASRWRGQRYSWVATATFPGYWGVTPGTYYWQAHYYTSGYGAVYYTGIGWFKIK